MIEVENVVYEYPGHRALDDVSFSAREGSITALVGPNGAGKTTLLRCIAALASPLSGNIYVEGKHVDSYPREVHEVVGYLSDFFGLYDQLTVRQCLTYMAWSRELPESKVGEMIERAAEKCEISDYLDKKTASLSRGYRQRLGIAQAIIHEPKVLLLDEPASGLDPESRNSLSKLFLSLSKGGATILVSSHILSELEEYCTDMVILRNGKIVEHTQSESEKKAEMETVVLELTEDGEAYLSKVQEAASKLGGISNIEVDKTRITFSFGSDPKARRELLKYLINEGVPVCGFIPRSKSLQDIYMGYAGNE